MRVNVIHSAVGAISESDILLAAASNAILIGFHVQTESSARDLALREGVELISGQFNEVLKGYGLAEIEAQGQPFDPNLHEALAEVPSDDHPPGTVMEETEKGYILNSKVVRPSRVVVSRASEEN